MTRIRDQQLLSLAARTVWAADASIGPLVVTILSRHYRGERLAAEELEEIRAASTRASSNKGESKGAVAVMPLWGPLVPHAGMMVDVSTEGTGLDQWRAMFAQAVADPEVGTVLIQVNSPGGSAEGVTETARAVREARSRKQIVAVADGYAASAAYAIAAQADTFLVTPSGMVGAVHTYMVHEDISQMLERQGVTPTLIAEPDNGANEITSLFPLTEENRAHLQSTVRSYYDMFVADVAKGRGVSTSTVETNFGRGRVMTAGQALASGMVDGIASYEETFARLLSGKPAVSSGRRAELATVVLTADFAGSGGISGQNWTIGGGGGFAGSAASGISASLDLVGELGPIEITGDGSPEDTTDPPETDRAQATVAGGGGTTTQEVTPIMDAVTTTDRPPTIEELAAQRDRNNERLVELNEQAAGRMFTPEEKAEYDELNEQIDGPTGINATISQLQSRATTMALRVKEAGGGIVGDGHQTDRGGLTVLVDGGLSPRGLPENLFDLHAYRRYAASHEQLGRKIADGARLANEKLAYATDKPDRPRAVVDRLLTAEANSDDQDGASRDGFATRFLVTADPNYEKQFSRWIRTGRDTDIPRMAVSIGGLGTETPVPITIDPTVLLDDDGAISPIRRISRVITITGNTWRGIASDGLVFTYDGELDPITPQTPDFRAPEATVLRATGEVQLSLEVDGDWPNLRNELARMFTKAKAVKEADAFLHGTGAGTKQPQGLVYALDVDDTSVVATAAANTLAIDDIRGLPLHLPPTFDMGAQWIGSKAFYSKANALSRAESNYDIWVPFAQGFATGPDGNLGYGMLGYPTNSASEMSSLFTTGGENVAVLGSFGDGFAIIDRVGLNVEFDAHPRDGNGKWTGARSLLVYFRNTSLLLSANAFRMLQIKST